MSTPIKLVPNVVHYCPECYRREQVWMPLQWSAVEALGQCSACGLVTREPITMTPGQVLTDAQIRRLEGL